ATRRRRPARGSRRRARHADILTPRQPAMHTEIPMSNSDRRDAATASAPSGAARRAPATRITAGAFCALALAAAPAAAAAQAAAVPTPESVFGFPVGTDYKLFDYGQSIDYFRKL